MGFIEDVRAQPDVVRRVAEAYRREHAPLVEAAAELLSSRPERPVFVIGMGSSLAAGRVLPSLFATRSRLAVVAEAGELLHYGLGSTAHGGAVIAISQSGRSIETVRVAERLRAERRVPVIALVNDLESPLAAVADLALPMLAGDESTVATRTYVATVSVLLTLAGTSLPGSVDLDAFEATATALSQRATQEDLAARAAAHIEGCRAAVLVARGPALGTAEYAALLLKEMAALPAEAIGGGAFRHGPLELAGPDVASIVVAPDGPTADLAVGLAGELAGAGTRTWLLVGPSAADAVEPAADLLVTRLDPLPEAFAALVGVVPLQLLGAQLAQRAGRAVGVTVRATKVTDRE